MNDSDLAALMSRSSLFDPEAVDWDAIPEQPVPADTLRIMRYMQDIETHTIMYLRELLSTRAVDEPEIAAFFATWLYEETAHSRALARFLGRAGQPVTPRPRTARSIAERFESFGIACIGAVWREFPAVHMTWGAINELTTLTAYRRLALLTGHPVLDQLLGEIMRDESRHFHFYYDQAERRLAASTTTQRVTRALVKRFWDPVGAGILPDTETKFIARYLFAGPDGGDVAAQTVDRTIRRLPGFEDLPLLETWIARNCPA
jgi:hypothetical protein